MYRMTRIIYFAVISFLILGASVIAQAQRWDVRTEFSLAQNPNGAWRYGLATTLGGAFIPYDLTGIDDYGGGIDFWYRSDNASEDLNPHVGLYDNPTTLPDGVLLHPGPAGQNSIVRWTAPATGLYNIQGSFVSTDSGSKRVQVRINNSIRVDNTIAGSVTAYFNVITVLLTANTTVDFIVDPNGGNQNDGTGLRAAVIAVSDGWRLAWQNTQNGDVSYWQMDEFSFASSGYMARSVPLAWKLIGALDLNNDGTNDLLWHNTTTGDVTYWIMNGTTPTGTYGYILRNVPLAWRPAAVADLNKDGRKDVIWQNTTTGDVTCWFMNGTAVGSFGTLARAVPTVWRIEIALDINADHNPDLLWRNTQSGDLTYWHMDGTTTIGSGYMARAVPLVWRIGGAADMDTDGDGDLVWHNSSTGDVSYWRLNGKSIVSTGYLYRNVPLAWRLGTGF